MRTLKIALYSVCLGALLLTSACSKRNRELDTLSPIPVSRENIVVWADATRWDLPAMLEDMSANRKKIGVIQPLLYGVEEGKIILHKKVGPNTIDDIVHAATKEAPYIQVRPVFGNVDYSGTHGKEVAKILSDPTLAREALTTIVQVASDQRFSGIDIDWEEIPIDSHESFGIFLKEVCAHVHKLGKNVSVALEPGSSAKLKHDVGEEVDYVEMLAYPIAHEGTGPGAIAPLSATESLLESSLQFIPRAKIILGLPFYGYVWEKWPEENELSANPISWKNWQEIRKDKTGEFAKFKDERTKDGEPSSTYIHYLSNSGSEHSRPATSTAWYEDAVSINRKIKVATSEKYRISRFAFWQIGQEDPKVWQMFK